MRGLMTGTGRQGHRWYAQTSAIAALLLMSWILMCGTYLRAPSLEGLSNRKFVARRAGRGVGIDRLFGRSDIRKVLERKEHDKALNLGRFGNMMVEMLSQNLPFTIFVPDAASMDRVMKTYRKGFTVSENSISDDEVGVELNSTGRTPETRKSGVAGETDATFLQCSGALASRLMSFSTVPRQIRSHTVPYDGELVVESLSALSFI